MKDIDTFERYISGIMSPDEKRDFENLVKGDKELTRKFQFYLAFEKAKALSAIEQLDELDAPPANGYGCYSPQHSPYVHGCTLARTRARP